MNVLRRVEVWGLLVLVAAGLIWVAVDHKRRQGGDGDAGADGPSAIRNLRVTHTRITPHAAHRQLRIEFTATNTGPEPFETRAPGVRLIDAAGNELPHFFAPGAFPPALAPGAAGASWGEFWLTAAQVAGPLTLEVGGRRTEVRVPSTGG